MSKCRVVCRLSRSSSSIAWSIKYLSREKSLYSKSVEDDLSLKEFRELQKTGCPYYKLIISPKEEKGIDFDLLAKMVVKNLIAFNGKKNFTYAYFIHKDTDHRHIHFLILPYESQKNRKQRDNFSISPTYAIKILQPALQEYLDNLQGKITEEEERIDRLQMIRANRETELDYLIEKSCKDGIFSLKSSYTLEEQTFILARLKYLESIDFVKQENEKIYVKDDLVWSLVILQKLLKHSTYLQDKDIPISKIHFASIGKDKIDKILSRVVDLNKRQISILALSQDGEYYLENEKLRTDEERDILTRESDTEIILDKSEELN